MNQGVYLDPIENADKTDFCIGVAGYPEKHYLAPDLDTDIAYLKAKVDAGASYIVTQMFFDNRYMYDFMERTEKAGINIPMICGIMPVAKYDQIKKFCSLCRTTIPKALEDELSKANGPEDEMKRGMDYVGRQVHDLMANGFKNFHIFTLNRTDVTAALMNNMGIKPHTA